MRMWGKYCGWVLFLVLLGLYWLRGSVILDPDFGWHVRMGQIILSKGIPATDVFSYTMPSFPMVDHEWLTNVFLAFSYPFSHLGGLAVLFSVLAVLPLYFLVSRFHKWLVVI